MRTTGRVGVYIDGFNLYYGARAMCSSGAQAWKWIDVLALTHRVIDGQVSFATANNLTGNVEAWSGADIARVVYCTARIDASHNPEGFAEQDVYLNALRASGAVDWIEFGHYVSRAKVAPLALRTGNPSSPEIFTSRWPVMVQDATGAKVPEARFLASYLHTEEKGSDVNVASHLVADVLSDSIDLAVVISNDSDLRLPIQLARGRVPVGVVSPRPGPAHGALRHHEPLPSTVHWNRNIRRADVLASQFPDTVAGVMKPPSW